MVAGWPIALLAAMVVYVAAAPLDSALPLDPDDDSSARYERSANLSHMTGTGRKVRMFIATRFFLQLFPDGVVNGTLDEKSNFRLATTTRQHNPTEQGDSPPPTSNKPEEPHRPYRTRHTIPTATETQNYREHETPHQRSPNTPPTTTAPTEQSATSSHPEKGPQAGPQSTPIRSILQRLSVGYGRVKIQGIATCTYLCMDSCGFLYSTRNATDECTFNEILQSNHYNVYSSIKYSDNHKTMYVGLNKSGIPRKVKLKANASMGPLSDVTNVLPMTVDQHDVEKLEAHHLRHHHKICPPPYHHVVTESAKCKRRKRKRKQRQKCTDHKCHEGKKAAKKKCEDEDKCAKKGKKKQEEKPKPPKILDTDDELTTVPEDSGENEFLDTDSL